MKLVRHLFSEADGHRARGDPLLDSWSKPGMDNSQLAQFTKRVEELIEADLSPRASSDDEARKECHESYAVMTTAKTREKENFEEVDAFFSRFDIQTHGKQGGASTITAQEVSSHYSVSYQPMALANERGDSNYCEGGDVTSKASEMKSHGEQCARKTMLKQGLSDRASGKKDKTKENRAPPDVGETYLPDHLGLWKSPWQKSTRPVYLESDIVQKSTRDRITARGRLPWKQHLENRLMGHPGYINIDFYSLMEASLVNSEDEDIDQAPWECRDVGQRFLYEKSLESRNWFGEFC